MVHHMTKPYLSIENVGVTFPGARASEVLRAIDLKVGKGQFVSNIGHSGCGKSTLLNVVAGLVHMTIGAVILDGSAVENPGPDRAVVFQNHSLLPWLSVYDNVALAVDKVFSGRKSGERQQSLWALLKARNLLAHRMQDAVIDVSDGDRDRLRDDLVSAFRDDPWRKLAPAQVASFIDAAAVFVAELQELDLDDEQSYAGGEIIGPVGT